jgi:DNA-binding CsgD family transcriptional regulator
MPSPSVPPAELRARLDALATHASSLRAYRTEVLDLLRTVVSFDAAVFHALSPRVPLETGVVIGIEPERIARSVAAWDDLAVELGALRELANARLVATDREAFPLGSRARARFERHIARPFNMQSLCLVHLVVRDSVRAAILLLSRKRRPLDAGTLAVLRELAPAIAVADTLHATLDGAPSSQLARRLVCRDQRLTPRQREVVEHVALGHTNAAIAQALGLSPNTARNYLARIFARVGAANRADLVRLAVLAPRAHGTRRTADR